MPYSLTNAMAITLLLKRFTQCQRSGYTICKFGSFEPSSQILKVVDVFLEFKALFLEKNTVDCRLLFILLKCENDVSKLHSTRCTPKICRPTLKGLHWINSVVNRDPEGLVFAYDLVRRTVIIKLLVLIGMIILQTVLALQGIEQNHRQ